MLVLNLAETAVKCALSDDLDFMTYYSCCQQRLWHHAHLSILALIKRAIYCLFYIHIYIYIYTELIYRGHKAKHLTLWMVFICIYVLVWSMYNVQVCVRWWWSLWWRRWNCCGSLCWRANLIVLTKLCTCNSVNFLSHICIVCTCVRALKVR